ncbi:MAG TPA: hypothetical protein VHB21_21285, partial [Minicystis sp.]|nr:hypothetical protein [Minicystis sp.]
MSQRAAVVVVVSALAHALVLAGWIGAQLDPPPRAPVAAASKLGGSVLDRASASAKRARIAEARRALVDGARAELRTGTLALGQFLLTASAIDADEANLPLDAARARDLYDARVDALRAALEHLDLRDAVPDVFADVRYFGRPGGLMAEALLERGGSCEPLAQLVVATAYDAGRGDEVALRFYGDDGSGAPHLAPIALTDGGDEFDLATGRGAFESGVRFAPEELVEVYARAHGLAAPDDEPEPARGDDEPGRGGASPGALTGGDGGGAPLP